MRVSNHDHRSALAIKRDIIKKLNRKERRKANHA